jgi:hypothetical protein
MASCGVQTCPINRGTNEKSIDEAERSTPPLSSVRGNSVIRPSEKTTKTFPAIIATSMIFTVSGMAQRYRYDHGKSVLQATLPKYASTWGMNDVKVFNVDRTAEAS